MKALNLMLKVYKVILQKCYFYVVYLYLFSILLYYYSIFWILVPNKADI